MSRKASHLEQLHDKRSMFIGRAYVLVAAIATVVFVWIYQFISGSLPAGLNIYFIQEASLITSFLFSLKKDIKLEYRIRILQSNYFSFITGSLLIADINHWSVLLVLSAFVAVMLTFQTIRSILGLFVFAGVVLVLSGVLLWTGEIPKSIDPVVIFFMLATITVGTMIVSVQKITDENKRFEGEEKLFSNKRILRGVLESTDDLIWSVDRNLRIIEANNSFNSFVENYLPNSDRQNKVIPEGEYFGYNWRKIMLDSFQGTQQKMQISLPGEEPKIMELQIHPIYEGQQVVAISGFGRNISETIKLQDKIILAKERYENAASATNDGIWEWDLANQHIHLSERLKEILGYGSSDISINLETFSQMFHPEDLPRIIQDFQSLIRSDRNQLVGEIRLKHADGHWVWMEGRGSAVRDEKGWVLRISGAITDISERKRSQLELQKLSLVASHTSNSVLISDAEGVVEWANDGFTRLTGYTKEEIIGRRPGPLLQGPETDEEVKKLVAQKIRLGESVSTEILNYSKSGSSYWINMEINPIRDEHGDIVNFIAIQTDITSQKVYELQLKVAKKKAEQAAMAKSEFLATMSHEIRTPMNAVIGMTGLLLDSEMSDEQRDFVDTIRISGDNLLNIINDILDFSKIDAGKLDLEQQPFLLPETVEDVLDLLSSKAQAQNLELTYEADPKVPANIISDPTRVNQVLVNLIGNAIKFTKEGEVSLSIKETHRFRNVSQIQFSVRDTGIGIPKDKANKLFQAFSQVDTSTTREYGGTGLGLAISSRLVQLMGGEIWVDSVPGEGSTFHFTIRVKRHDDSTFGTYILPAHTPITAGKRALLIDDNHTNLRILQSQLSTWGISCETCDQPLEVLSKVRAEDYDLLIMDMHMPELNGLGLARQLTDQLGAKLPPMMMLTSLGQSLREKEREYFQAFLHKPVRREQLYKHIHKILIPQQQLVSARPEAKMVEAAQVMPDISILIAEDNLVNQKVARRMLKKMGYNAEVVANGQEALEIVQRRKFDLIFMDMRMPVMDGLEATRRIRRKFSSDQLKIIAMTANAMKGDREECINAGMDDYVTKPVKLELIREAILRTFASVAEESVKTA